LIDIDRFESTCNTLVSRDFIEDSNLFRPDSSLLESTAFIFQNNHKEFKTTPTDSICKILNC